MSQEKSSMHIDIEQKKCYTHTHLAQGLPAIHSEFCLPHNKHKPEVLWI